MKKVELYRSLSELDLEDTELFIEHLVTRRYQLVEEQKAVETVRTEAAAVTLPEGLVAAITHRGGSGAPKDPNSARGLGETFLRTQGRFRQDEFFKFLKEKRPELSQSAGVQALVVLTRTGVAKKEGWGGNSVYTLAN